MNRVNEYLQKKNGIQRWQIISVLLVIYDICAVVVSYFLALMLRFDFRYSSIPSEYLGAYLGYIPIAALVCVIAFKLNHNYSSVWRFASSRELFQQIAATIVTGVINALGITFLYCRMPVSYYITGIVLQFCFTLGIRFSYRFIRLLRGRNNSGGAQIKKCLLVGAGEAGQIILRDIERTKKVGERICCIIDDDPNKVGRFVDGVKIYGDRNCILSAVDEFSIDKIYVAIPSASAADRRDILNICKDTGCELKNLPSLYQFLCGEASVNRMQDVAIEDLLGRDPVKVNMEEIYKYIEGKTILITGGGGSIGSELSRQVAAHNPKQFIIFDVYENNAYDIQLELKKRYPYLNLVVLIGSVRDSRKIFQVFETYRPQIVYHAAAHKHVPLMEDSPCESIKNNAIGTYKTAFAAMVHGCERFVLISTDKVVNPTSIMGASKRLCEMIIQAFDCKVKQGDILGIPQLFTHYESKDWANDSEIIEKLKSAKTEFVAVRFGNVLGSNGSVVPLFKKQISAGGPVTVTHPDIIRYFMTIPEAVSLVMQAGTYAHGGEIFVLDMGEPVKIDTLARNLIKLSGLKPDVDIKVEYTGLRPGEKLYEEKLMAEEGMKKTANELIHIARPIPFDIDVFLGQLEELMECAYKNKAEIREFVQKVVCTYHPT